MAPSQATSSTLPTWIGPATNSSRRSEQEQHDTDFREDLYRTDVPDEIQTVRPDQGAGDQESGNRREPELMEDKDDGDRDGENNEEVAEHTVISHSHPLDRST